MQLKKPVKLLLFIIFIVIRCNGQTDWSRTSDWRLYDVHTSHAFPYRMDTLHTFKLRTLDNDSIHLFLQHVNELKKGEEPVWMGMYVTSCKMNDGLYYKIDVSVYGGFFYVEKTKIYYEVSPVLKQDWLAFFNNNMERLLYGAP